MALKIGSIHYRTEHPGLPRGRTGPRKQNLPRPLPSSETRVNASVGALHPFWILALLILLAGCEKAAPVSSEYYLISPLLIAGAERPPAPTNLTANYDPGSRSILLEWQAAVQPDTGIPWNDFIVYFFLSSPPSDIYQDRFRLANTSRTYYSIDSDPFNGTIYFAVTTQFNGSESVPSNFAELSL